MIDNTDLTTAIDILCSSDEFLIVSVKRTEKRESSFNFYTSDDLLLPIITDFLIHSSNNIFENDED